jgi:calcium/calmodulin-dependent protein kinase I
MQEDESDGGGDADVPVNSQVAAGEALTGGDFEKGLPTNTDTGKNPGGKKSLGNVAKGAIFREVVLAKVREAKEQEEALKVAAEAQEKEAKRRSFQG